MTVCVYTNQSFFSQDGLSVLGGCIGAMHIPEKWLPGMVDMYLNSHNIMHVLVVLAVFSMHQVRLAPVSPQPRGKTHHHSTSM